MGLYSLYYTMNKTHEHHGKTLVITMSLASIGNGTDDISLVFMAQSIDTVTMLQNTTLRLANSAHSQLLTATIDSGHTF